MENTLQTETAPLSVEVKKGCPGSTAEVCCEDSTESCSLPEARNE